MGLRIFSDTISDSSGNRQTGLSSTLLLTIIKSSDLTIYDWSDQTFKLSPITPSSAASEINASIVPGDYYWDIGNTPFDGTTSLQDGDYIITAYESTFKISQSGNITIGNGRIVDGNIGTIRSNTDLIPDIPTNILDAPASSHIQSGSVGRLWYLTLRMLANKLQFVDSGGNLRMRIYDDDNTTILFDKIITGPTNERLRISDLGGPTNRESGGYTP